MPTRSSPGSARSRRISRRTPSTDPLRAAPAMRAVAPRLKRLRVVVAEANSSRDSATVRVDSGTDPNPERTYSPAHFRSGLCPDPDPLHLAAGAAAFDQGRGGGA